MVLDMMQLPSPDDERDNFRLALNEIGFTASDLAKHMAKYGDRRDYTATVRSIQRMLAGDTRVSGEMAVISQKLLRQHLRLKEKYSGLEWSVDGDGRHIAEIEGWKVFLTPKSKGRWLIECYEKTGYRVPWERWQNSLAAAKIHSPVYVEEAIESRAESRWYDSKEC